MSELGDAIRAVAPYVEGLERTRRTVLQEAVLRAAVKWATADDSMPWTEEAAAEITVPLATAVHALLAAEPAWGEGE